MTITISPTNYAAATRISRFIIAGVYLGAGCLISYAMRHLPGSGMRSAIQIAAAILLSNLVIWLFQRIQLPRAEARLQKAIAAKNGEEFARAIVKREMARAIQPVGGIAMTLGLLLMALLIHVMA